MCTEDEFVFCMVCGKGLKTITNTHLKTHNMTTKEYKEKFPNSKFMSNNSKTKVSRHFVGKSYEDLYGEDRAKELKEKRSNDAVDQFLDPQQREIRREGVLGRQLSDETKEKIGEANSVYYNKVNIGVSKIVRDRVFVHFDGKCAKCESKDDLHVHHIRKIDQFENMIQYSSEENLILLCVKCHGKEHRGTNKYPNVSLAKLIYAYRDIIGAFGYYRKDSAPDFLKMHLAGTPYRAAHALTEILSSVGADPPDVTVFDSDYDDMVVVKDIKFTSMCIHHLLPFDGVCHVAYIPKDKVIGLSKIPRVVEFFSKKLQIQEVLVSEIANYLYEKIDADGVMVVMKAKHQCVACRGVEKDDVRMVCSAIRGTFTDSAVRAEALELMKK